MSFLHDAVFIVLKPGGILSSNRTLACYKKVVDNPDNECLDIKSLCDQSFLNESAYSADESNVKVLFKHPSTTFVYSKT